MAQAGERSPETVRDKTVSEELVLVMGTKKAEKMTTFLTTKKGSIGALKHILEYKKPPDLSKIKRFFFVSKEPNVRATPYNTELLSINFKINTTPVANLPLVW